MEKNTFPAAPRRPFVGVLVKCCGIYVRAHLAPRSEAYVGECPRCATPVRIALSPEAGGSRLAKAS